LEDEDSILDSPAFFKITVQPAFGAIATGEYRIFKHRQDGTGRFNLHCKHQIGDQPSTTRVYQVSTL